MAGVNTWRFPNLKGSVLWVPDRLEVTNATSGLYGGTARFDYILAPFGQKNTPTRAKWDVSYKDVSLARLTDFLETNGLRLDGRASGRNHLEWDLGKWSEKRGNGEVTATAPPGVPTMTREFQPDVLAAEEALPPEAGPFNPRAPLGHLPIGGHVVYALDPKWITLDQSWVATPRTYVEFHGRTAYGEQSQIPFHVTSLDWLESDRVLAGIMTAFGSPTGAVPIGGSGQFDGVMLLGFTKPRIEGSFTGRNMRAWDTTWGEGTARVVIENGYVQVSESSIRRGDSQITAEGKFSLGYPRRDGGEEINALVRITRRPLIDLRHAFLLDTYPVDGFVSGEYHLYGKYETPFGFGRLTIDDGAAYGEPFETATAALRFEGSGVRLDALEIHKSTARITGAAWVGWDGNYSFDADGARIPVESLKMASFPRAPLSGVLQFTATGSGTFDVPRYDVRVRVDDLFAADEGIGQLTGRLALRGELLTTELEVASPRLVVSGSGRIAMTDQMDAELTLRFANTSLDPYLRFFAPQLSPFTTAVAGGTVRVVGELADIDHLAVNTCVEDLDLKLFDYRLSNRSPRNAARSAAPPSGGACAEGPDVILLDLNQNVVEHRPAAAVRRRHRVVGRRQRGPERLDDCGAGIGRRQPRHPAGLLSRHPELRRGDAEGGDQRPAGKAGVLRQRHDRQRENPAAHAAAFARSDQRADCVRSRRRPRRRRAREAGQRRRDVRRPGRVERLHPRGDQPDRGRPADADPVPGRLSIAD